MAYIIRLEHWSKKTGRLHIEQSGIEPENRCDVSQSLELLCHV